MHAAATTARGCGFSTARSPAIALAPRGAGGWCPCGRSQLQLQALRPLWDAVRAAGRVGGPQGTCRPLQRPVGSQGPAGACTHRAPQRGGCGARWAPAGAAAVGTSWCAAQAARLAARLAGARRAISACATSQPAARSSAPVILNAWAVVSAGASAVRGQPRVRGQPQVRGAGRPAGCRQGAPAACPR